VVGHFKLRDADDEQKAVLSGVEQVIVSVREKHDQSHEVQIAEYIAANRMQRKALAVQQHISRTTARQRIKSPLVEEVALAPKELEFRVRNGHPLHT
jgi:hypothetical protein